MAEEGILAFHLPDEPLSEVSDKYFAAYEELHQAVREPFTGLRQTIAHLHQSGIPVGVVTGKGERGAYATLRMLELLPFFQVIETGFLEGANKPESLRRAAQRLGIEPHQVVYVGDTGYDVASASAIGMPMVGAGWAETTTLTPENAGQALHVFRTTEAFHEWAVTAFCAPEVAS
jgi:HAD superfamily hydrolase (TIGR01549 family)